MAVVAGLEDAEAAADVVAGVVVPAADVVAGVVVPAVPGAEEAPPAEEGAAPPAEVEGF